MPGFVRATGTGAQACTFVKELAGLEDFAKYFLRLFPLKTHHFEEGLRCLLTLSSVAEP